MTVPVVSSVAVLSDIHGVLPVLDAVLAEPDVQAAELVVVTGDHAAGPMRVPVLDRLTELGDRCRLEVFAGLDSAVRTVVCGHTHMPFVRLVDRRLVINPGSVGMPYGRPGGAWALLRGGQVELRHTPVDIDAAIAAVVAGSGYPGRVAWAEEYLRSANSDADAVRAFGPRDGRRAP